MPRIFSQCIQRTRKGKVLLVLKKGGNVSAFQKVLDQVVGARATITALVSKRSLEIWGLDETEKKKTAFWKYHPETPT